MQIGGVAEEILVKPDFVYGLAVISAGSVAGAESPIIVDALNDYVKTTAILSQRDVPDLPGGGYPQRR